MLPMRQDIFRKMDITIIENQIMQWIDVRIGRTLQNDVAFLGQAFMKILQEM